MNVIIQEIAKRGLSQEVYNAICATGLIISLLYSLWHGRKFGIPIWKVLITLSTVYLCMGMIQSGILEVLLYIRKMNFLGIKTAVNSIVRVIVFIPLIGYVVSKVLKLKWSLVCDAIALFPLLMSGIYQLACIFTGCCRGYACTWGLYSAQTRQYHFPVPILETILTLAIFAYLVIRTKRRCYTSDGTLYPLMMVFYGIMRFVCEMLRDNEKIILGCSAIAIHAVFMCVVGATVLGIIEKKKRRGSVSPIVQ